MSIKQTYDWYVKEGYINAVRQGGLTLYKYSSRTAFERNWNYHTITARGLILDDSGKRVGCGFSKFFNVSERPETRFEALPAETPELADKLDGSCVITFFNPETSRWQAVTLGSWDNVQTQFANKWIEPHLDKLDKAYSYVWEVTGPWNRIVVFYPEEKMTLIGIIHTESTEDWSYKQISEFAANRGFDSVKFLSRPITDINLEDPSILNQEGFVARFSNGLRVKIKYSNYLRLHKILTGLSVKGIWEVLANGTPMDLTNVPDEFLTWFDNEKIKILNSKNDLESKAREIFVNTPKLPDRKSYAAYFKQFENPLPSILFRMLDGRSADDILWASVKPSVYKTFQIAEA